MEAKLMLLWITIHFSLFVNSSKGELKQLARKQTSKLYFSESDINRSILSLQQSDFVDPDNINSTIFSQYQSENSTKHQPRNSKSGKRHGLKQKHKRKHAKHKEHQRSDSEKADDGVIILDVNNPSLSSLIKQLNRNPEISYERLVASSGLLKPGILTHQSRINGQEIDTVLAKKNNPGPINIFSGAPATFKYHVDSNCDKEKIGCMHTCDKHNQTRCACFEGFYLDTDGRSCLDINECLDNNGNCQMNCRNTPGSYFCTCRPGYRLSIDQKTCVDIDECLLRNGHGPCQDNCVNTPGSYLCECKKIPGTRLGKDGHSCEDVDECSLGESGCSHGCINAVGRAFCTCPEGLQLGGDWKTCIDINECNDVSVSKLCLQGCMNTLGSYKCLGQVREQSDQAANLIAPSRPRCPKLHPPSRMGIFKCRRKRFNRSRRKMKHIRRKVMNKPETKCQLVCQKHFQRIGEYKVICGMDGKWHGEKTGKCVKIE